MKFNKTYILIILVIIIAGVFLNKLLVSNYQLEEKRIEDRLLKAHSDAVINSKSTIKVYAALVSSLRSHVKNSPQFPSELELQNYLKDLLKELNFKDSIIVNYIDKNHVFKYVITPHSIDDANLKGLSVKDFRSEKIIKELDMLMQHDKITLFDPINLREGWVGFPFNFSVKNNQDEVLGYMAPIINVKYLLDNFYNGPNNDKYIHKFIVNDSIDLTREVLYDGTTSYNKNRDAEYYKNYEVKDDQFVYSNVRLFNLNLKIGSAYKDRPKTSILLNVIGYFWYVLISSLVLISFYQYRKNKTLNRELSQANLKILSKNKDLENNLTKIETLIKEIHHRVKNNMQMISGILTLQQEESEDKKVISALDQSKNRINSMALVHEKLYGSTSLKDVRIKDYIAELIEFVEQTIADKNIIVSKTLLVDDTLIFDAETTSYLGLIINELITNSYKHAFKINQDNMLYLNITKEDEFYKLDYDDNGEGIPEGFDIENSESLGFQLMYILTDQLNGQLVNDHKNKSRFTIYFKQYHVN